MPFAHPAFPFSFASLAMTETRSTSSESGSEREYTAVSFSAPTSDDASAPPSPAPSMYSITSSIIENSFRILHGRRINNHSDIYQLPADEEELLRLDAQEPLLFNALTTQYHRIPQCLADNNRAVTKACLDLGSGSGRWAQQIAETYPHCSVVGVDLVPVRTAGPPNLRFEVDDINLGLDHFYDCFDVVHARAISSGIKDYYGLVDQISRVLRPNGLVLLADWDYRVFDENKNVIVVPTDSKTTKYPLPRWVRAISQAMRSLGANLDAAPLFGVWLRQHYRFRDVKTTDTWISCDMKLFDFWKDYLCSCRPLLLAYGGFDTESLLCLEDAVLHSLRNNAKRMYIRILSASAYRF